MTEIFKKSLEKSIIWIIVITLMLLFGGGCNKSPVRPFRIGILSYVSIHALVIEGFKEGMIELGYTEGRDIEYIYNGVLENNQEVIDAEIRNLLSQEIDMLLTVGNRVSLQAKKAVDRTGIPILFSACTEVIEVGLVEGMTHPEGNITGIVNVDATTKALESMKMIVHDLKKVYLPYNPDDEVSIISISVLKKTAFDMGIEIVYQEVHSVEETVAAIENMPKDVNAIFRIPSPTLDPINDELSQAAIRRGIPMVSRLPLDKDVLLSFASDFNELGKQTARLAHQIRNGVKPADLPIEAAEFYLTVNLKTADKIGILIPNDVLVLATTIIR